MRAVDNITGGSVKCIVWARKFGTVEVRGLGMPYPLARMEDAIRKYDEGAFIQDAFHFLTPDEREFMLTGLYGDEFDALHSDEFERLGEQ